MPTAFQQVSPGQFLARGTLTNQGAATVEELTGAPAVGRVTRMTVIRSAGAGATIDPSITRSNTGATTDVVAAAVPSGSRTAPETDLLVDEAGTAEYALASGNSSLYLWPVFDAGADNECSFEVHVITGWYGNGEP